VLFEGLWGFFQRNFTKCQRQIVLHSRRVSPASGKDAHNCCREWRKD